MHFTWKMLKVWGIFLELDKVVRPDFQSRKTQLQVGEKNCIQCIINVQTVPCVCILMQITGPLCMYINANYWIYIWVCYFHILYLAFRHAIVLALGTCQLYESFGVGGRDVMRILWTFDLVSFPPNYCW